MAIAYVDNALGANNSTTTFSITLPTTAAGDILILEFCHRGTGDGTIAGTSVTTDGLTWTKKHSQTFGSSYSGKTYWTRCTGNHAGKTVTGASLTDSCAAILTHYSGCIASGDPLADATVVGEANASGNETQAQITTTTAGAWVVLVVVNSPDLAVATQACTSPGALTERAERLSTGGTDTSIAHASAEKAAAGATGALTWAQTNAASGSWAYALKPNPVFTGTASEDEQRRDEDATGAETFTGTGSETEQARDESAVGEIPLTGTGEEDGRPRDEDGASVLAFIGTAEETGQSRDSDGTAELLFSGTGEEDGQDRDESGLSAQLFTGEGEEDGQTRDEDGTVYQGTLILGGAEEPGRPRDEAATGEVIAAEIPSTQAIGLFFYERPEQLRITGRGNEKTAPAKESGKGIARRMIIGSCAETCGAAGSTARGILRFIGKGDEGRPGIMASGSGRITNPEDDLIEILSLMEDVA